MATGRHLLPICLGTAAWSFSFGLGSQVISHWLNGQGADNTTIGLNHSTYYLGLALGSLAVPWLNRRLGNYCTVFGMIVSGLTLALFPWASTWESWFVLRFLNGLAGAMSLVPLEILIGGANDPDRRTRDFSLYGVALTLGGALGIMAGLHFYTPGNPTAFYCGGLIPAAAGLFLARLLPQAGAPASASLCEDKVAGARHFLSYGTAWFQGFLEGGLLAFLSLYLVGLEMSADEAGLLMGVTMVGVIVFQVPVAWLANRLGRLNVLLCCYGVVALGLIIVPLWPASPWLGISLFVLGACSGALYPLALAMLADRLPASGLPRAYAWFLAMECVGSQMGSAVMGKARDLWGETSMFSVGVAALIGILGIWATLTIWRRGGQQGGIDEPRQAA